MTLEEAQVLSLKVLKQVMEEKLDHNNVQLAQVCPRSTRSKSRADRFTRPSPVFAHLHQLSILHSLPSHLLAISLHRSCRRRASRSWVPRS